MTLTRFLVCFGLALTIVAGCSRQPDESPSITETNKRPVVAVVCYAHEYLVQRLAGEWLDVRFPAAHESNPATWRPSAEDISELQSADMIIVNGPGAVYCEWLPRVSLPESKICRASEDLPLSDFISVSDYRIVHQHGPEGEHSHAYMVPFTWLDPEVAARQVEKIAGCLADRWPDHVQGINQNRDRLVADLRELAQAMKGPLIDRPVITTTPQLKYLTRAFGAEDHHLLWFDVPNQEQWESTEREKLRKLMEQTEPTLVLAAVTLPNYISDEIRQAGGKVVQVPLLDRNPNGDASNEVGSDYLSIMKNVVQAIREASSQSNSSDGS